MMSLRAGAVLLANCTHCKALAGSKCKTEKGKVLEVPHARRVWDLMHMPGFSLANYQTQYPQGEPIAGGNTHTPKRGPDYE